MSAPRVIVKGGVLSPSEFKQVAELAEQFGFDAISFGSRQDIIFPGPITDEQVNSVTSFEIVSGKERRIQNIVSSYLTYGIFPGTAWLTGDKYLYILEQFRESPSLKVNIVDSKQRLVPMFTGHLNFIASEHEDYWYLYARIPGWQKVQLFPVLVFSWDIADLVDAIEEILLEEPEDINMLFALIGESASLNNRTVDKNLELPFYPFPYYEGMNRVGFENYWLGLYWRNNLYDTAFIKAMCDLCLECKIGKISITPWKSFILKGIPLEKKLNWEKLLGSFGINVRHSMLELNWHLPVSDRKALELKRYLVSEFDKKDISTYGLTFSITEAQNQFNYFTSIVIERNSRDVNLQHINLRDSYNLLYAKNFDPNTLEYFTYAQDIDESSLPNLLMEMSKQYFQKLGNTVDETNTEVKENSEKLLTEVLQCPDCLTIYDPQFGDPDNGIAVNTAIEDLPYNYACAICDADLSVLERRIMSKVTD